MNISLKRVIGILLIVILASVGLSNNLNIGEVKAEGKLSKTHGNINNTQDIKNFMNNYFSEKMKKYSVPGVSVVVVKDNKEMFKKGYGYSNLESKTPVDPDKTRFPAGSVSKLFTATAIMQLYEEGKIDLDKNVNDYISPYKVINKYDKPVTCRNLLTHSSGLDEESELNVSTTDVNSIKPQEYYFDTHSLKVVTEPNTVCRYSNIGYNLLGYIVEKTSGISYEKYVEEKILKPLNMSNSSVRLKSGSTSAGYVYDNDKYVETPFAYQYTSGSSGIIATAKDMENFIIENLNNGKFNDNNILNQKTLAMMHDKQFSNSKFLPGIGFGFIRSYRNGHEIIKHEGGLPGYTTTLFLIPKENLGIYVATNTLGALPFNFEEEFLNYFYPENSNNFSAAKKNANKDYSKYDGTYRSYDGTSKNNIMKLNVLFDPTMDMKIKDNKDGTLTLHEFTPAKEEITTTLVEVKNGVFLRQDGRGKFAFRTDKEGKVTYAFNDISENSFEKVNFYNEREFIMSVLSISIIMFIINPILFVILFIRRKSKKCKEPKKIRSIKVLKLLNIIIEVFNIVGVLGAVSLEMMMINNYDFSFKYLLYFFLTLLIVSTVIIPFSLALLVYSLVKKNGSIKARGYYIFLNITNLAFIWILYYFNFLGYKI